MSFTRHFHRPQPLRTSAQIRQDVGGLEREAGGLPGDLLAAKLHEFHALNAGDAAHAAPPPASRRRDTGVAAGVKRGVDRAARRLASDPRGIDSSQAPSSDDR
jgi:hypothetical protein